MLENDIKFLKLAVENSRQSMAEGNFPAGAVVAKKDKILSSQVSSPFPGLWHADSKAIASAYNEYGSLKDSTLYIGLESCLMCTGVAYWSGIRRIVFAIPKSRVSGNYYETHQDTTGLATTFNERMELIHIPQLEEEALQVIREWEMKTELK